MLAVLYFFVPAYVANMAPVLVRPFFRSLAVPLDGGATLRGRRVLGDHKTWRGLLAGVVAGMLVWEAQVAVFQAGFLPGLAILDYSAAGIWPGVLLGFGALVGDAAKSFLKRQLDIAPGESWLGPDQLDFMVGAFACVSVIHVPPLLPTLAGLPLVFLGDMAVSAIGFSIGMKDAPI
jgi:CDP-2,3-bis-(O-geranylgeranyl)-sn-glycerol synthase